jgi:hypothetical protein
MNALLNPSFALIGVWELLAILAVLLTLAVVAAAVISLIVVLAIWKRATPVSAVSASPMPDPPGTAPLPTSAEKP